MKKILMKLMGATFVLIAIYLYASFDEFVVNRNLLRESCEIFGVASGFVCQYLRAINWFLVSLFGGFGYAFLTYKIKPIQQPCV